MRRLPERAAWGEAFIATRSPVNGGGLNIRPEERSDEAISVLPLITE